MRVVIDTNLLVSATITEEGNPARIIKAWRDGKIEIVISPEILREIREVLFRPKIRALSHWSDKEIEEFIDGLNKSGIVVEDKPGFKVIKEDPEDDKFIASAIQGKAEYIISGDPHLKRLKEYQGVKPPAEFVKILRWKTA